MDFGSLFLAAAVGAVAAFLYWLYTFAVAPFKVLSRYGIQGPPPVAFYGNQKMVIKMGRMRFITNMLERYRKLGSTSTGVAVHFIPPNFYPAG